MQLCSSVSLSLRRCEKGGRLNKAGLIEASPPPPSPSPAGTTWEEKYFSSKGLKLEASAASLKVLPRGLQVSPVGVEYSFRPSLCPGGRL